MFDLGAIHYEINESSDFPTIKINVVVLFKRFEHLNVSPWETSSPALSAQNIRTVDAYIYTK